MEFQIRGGASRSRSGAAQDDVVCSGFSAALQAGLEQFPDVPLLNILYGSFLLEIRQDLTARRTPLRSGAAAAPVSLKCPLSLASSAPLLRRQRRFK